MVALPMMAGPTNLGDLGSAMCSRWVMMKLASWMEFSAARVRLGLIAGLALQAGHIVEFRVVPGCAIVLAALRLWPAAALVSERGIRAGLWPGPWAAWT